MSDQNDVLTIGRRIRSPPVSLDLLSRDTWSCTEARNLCKNENAPHPKVRGVARPWLCDGLPREGESLSRVC